MSPALEADEERLARQPGVQRADGGLERRHRIVAVEAEGVVDGQDARQRAGEHGDARDVVPQSGQKPGDVADAPDGDVAIAAATEGTAASEPGQEHGARALDGGRQHVPVVHEGLPSYAAGHEVGNVSPADGALI